MSHDVIEIRCPFCKALFKRKGLREKTYPLRYCAYCGAKLYSEEAIKGIDKHAIFLREHAPKTDEVMGSIGHFLLLKQIGRGGMGEVFLAYDTVCGRRVALKRIRPDLMASPLLYERFLREARITSQLTHPSIIPIYSIFIEKELVYYTMPYMEGQTLKELLVTAKKNAEDPKEIEDHHTSIPTLVRLYLGILQAVAYAHSKEVLHRDLKPENIIIGTYGQVLILDWGLTKLVEEKEEPGIEKVCDEKLTRIGKLVGTIPYMAPERAQGKPATKQTDIYALGVILYQILTLKLPFPRKSMKSFLETWESEILIPPEIRAPYRDVPQALSEIVKKSLSKDPSLRHDSCDELIHHIECFLEGRSEWFPVSSLKIQEKGDWEFQENILFAEHTAITRTSELADWYSLSLSKESFHENMRLEATFRLGTRSHGIGFILCSPESENRLHLTDGFCLWLSSIHGDSRETTLFRSSASVFEAPDVALSPHATYHIRFEKVEQTVKLFINDILQFTYISHIPVIGTHVGVLSQDDDYEVDSIVVSVGSQNIMVNCLAIPDAFLASHLFERALSEYRRIGAAFPGRQEGRDALFRAGITILEEGKASSEQETRAQLFDQALTEFQKLRHTPGAPLEYLGKAFVYQTTKEFLEEIKCFELAFRRYKRHPLLNVLIEQIILRMHESSKDHRIAAYHFVLLVARFLPQIAEQAPSQKLFTSLKRHWETPPFFLSSPLEGDQLLRRQRFSLALAFWLHKPHTILEIFDELLTLPILPSSHLADCLFLFLLLGREDLLQGCLNRWQGQMKEEELRSNRHLFSCLSLLLSDNDITQTKAILHRTRGGSFQAHTLLLLMEQAIRTKHYEKALSLFMIRKETSPTPTLEEEFIAKAMEAALWLKKKDTIDMLVELVPQHRFLDDHSPLFFWYGCYLASRENMKEAVDHFEKVFDIPYPRSWLLGPHVLTGRVALNEKGWITRSFAYERHVLLRQLLAFRHVTGDDRFTHGIELLLKKEKEDE